MLWSGLLCYFCWIFPVFLVWAHRKHRENSARNKIVISQNSVKKNIRHPWIFLYLEKCVIILLKFNCTII